MLNEPAQTAGRTGTGSTSVASSFTEIEHQPIGRSSAFNQDFRSASGVVPERGVPERGGPEAEALGSTLGTTGAARRISSGVELPGEGSRGREEAPGSAGSILLPQSGEKVVNVERYRE